MDNIARRFIKKHADTIRCEPSGLLLTELVETKIQKLQLIQTNNRRQNA